jgi:hypothetical protein
MNTNQQSKDRLITLTPGKEISVDVSGAFFFIESADGPFSISFNDGPYLSARSGLEVNNFEFQKIKFRSDITAGGATITVRYYAGTAYVTNRNPTVYTKPAPTYIVGYSETLAQDASYTIPNTNLRTGQPSADRQVRVQIMTTGGNGYLQVLIGGVNIGFAGSSHPLYTAETTQEVTIRSYGDNQAYHVGVFYELRS